MFTGIIERTARVDSIEGGANGRRIRLGIAAGGASATGTPWRAAELGESIAVSGVCLTVVELGGDAARPTVAFDAIPETLSRTTLGTLGPGSEVNVERSLRVGDAFGGHYVTGHVDAVGEIVERRVEGEQTLFRIACREPWLLQIIPKGSIAVDGVSLTVIDVDRAGGWFSFAAIPHTLEHTTLGRAPVGDRVNLETDAFGKWVLHALDVGLASAQAVGAAHEGAKR